MTPDLLIWTSWIQIFICNTGKTGSHKLSHMRQNVLGQNLNRGRSGPTCRVNITEMLADYSTVYMVIIITKDGTAAAMTTPLCR